MCSLSKDVFLTNLFCLSSASDEFWCESCQLSAAVDSTMGLRWRLFHFQVNLDFFNLHKSKHLLIVICYERDLYKKNIYFCSHLLLMTVTHNYGPAAVMTDHGKN